MDLQHVVLNLGNVYVEFTDLQASPALQVPSGGVGPPPVPHPMHEPSG